MTTLPSNRSIKSITKAHQQLEGGGFTVARPFPSRELELLDPFLLLDEMEPTTYAPGKALGAPDHPHRGFETVTYVLKGEVEHRDSIGSVDTIKQGEVQWMTAGSGIVHSEMPSTQIQTNGGEVHGFQLWVNLPASKKMVPPKYQPIEANQLGELGGQGWSGVLIAGETLGVVGPAVSHTPITYAHLSIEPNAGEILIPISSEQTNCAIFVFEGEALLGPEEQSVKAKHIAVFEDNGSNIRMLGNPHTKTELLLMAGQPIGESVARSGPFVMNTRQELMKAFEDYQAGRMGSIAPTGARQ